jgi:Na+/H+ antiporter NhaD/arsenite permease-like protein
MLWIGGQITSFNIMETLFFPSLVCLFVPLIAISFNIKGEIGGGEVTREKIDNPLHASIMLFCGIGGLLFVPIFKTITHLPPYAGILLSLGIIWIISEVLDSKKDEEERKVLSVAHALSKIDSSSVLFFLGILLAIASLESTHVLSSLAKTMDELIKNEDIIVIVIGLASAVIDNVPLVAACIGMYDLTAYPVDSKIWEFLAYCAGTGGSILIIGSAAGVAVMGMEKIDFVWYVRKISLYALIGYFAGAAVYIGIYYLLHH